MTRALLVALLLAGCVPQYQTSSWELTSLNQQTCLAGVNRDLASVLPPGATPDLRTKVYLAMAEERGCWPKQKQQTGVPYRTNPLLWR